MRHRKTIAILGVLSFVGPALPAQSSQSLNAQFDSLIAAEYKSNQPGGVILVAKRGEVVYERAFGLANLELGVPMQKNAVFSIASLTKQFTAVAVLQQVEKGTLALTDTVGKFLPNYPAALKGITIEQLLTHTAGVPAAKSIGSLLALGRSWLSADQVMATFRDQPLDFRPGTQMVYSNSGYQLLGYIVEKVTGEPYPDFVEKTLLKPAGMEYSLWGNDMKVVPNRASPYVYTRNGIENAVNGNVQIAWAAGALQSTAGDFLKWHRALLAETFIKKATLQKAWTPCHLEDGSLTDYGYGWFLGELQGSPLVEHGGNMGGFMSHAIYLPREDILVGVFLNARGNRLPELVATDLVTLAMGKPLQIAPIVLASELLQSYTGVYKDKSPANVVLTVDNGTLFYQRGENPRLRATPYGKDKVFFENTSIVGAFQRDLEGRITGLATQSLRRTTKNVLTRVTSGGR